MDFKHLEAFVEVVRHQSFTKAAKALFLAQPSVSGQIQQLESELGTRLLDRTTKSIRLTSAGEALYEYATGILALQSRMIRYFANPDQAPIRIGASTIPSAYLLPGVLAKYRLIQPDFKFELYQAGSEKILSGFDDGLYDLCFTSLRSENPAYCCGKIWEDRLVMITAVSERYLHLKSTENPFPVLFQEPILFREQGSGSLLGAERFYSLFGIRDNDLNVVARVNDTEAIKRMVEAGLGVAVVSNLAVQDEARAGRLLAFEVNDPTTEREIYLCYRRNETFQPAKNAFIAWLEDTVHKPNENMAIEKLDRTQDK